MKTLFWTIAALCALAMRPASGEPRVGIGINYVWFKLHLTTVAVCRTSGEPRSVGEWYLPQYDVEAVRAIVRRQLSAMRQSGFTTLRVLAFYDRGTGRESDSFVSPDGTIVAGDQAKLAAFVRDVAAMGFRTLEIGPTFVEENDLYCREREWGDCFQPDRTGENWRFIESVARIAIAAAGGLNVRFDLGNEQAPDPAMPPSTRRKTKTYLQTIASRFQKEFGSRWLISAARSDRSTSAETAARLNLLVADLGEAGLRPPYLELHTYSADGNDLVESLDEMEAIAQRIGAFTILGELRYHSNVQAKAISAWLGAHRDSHLVDVIQWPEYDPSQICAIDPVPPYTPGAFAEINAR